MNMKKRGFTFIECILAMGILSVIVVTIYPIMDTSFVRFTNVDTKNELRTIAQSTIEILKSEDELSNYWIEELERTDSISIDTEYIQDGYNCIINILYNSEKLMEVEVIVTNNIDKVGEELGLKASIRK